MSLKNKIQEWLLDGALESLKNKRLNFRGRIIFWMMEKKIHNWVEVDKMKSWKTTLCGGLAALGTYLSTQKDPEWLGFVGTILTGLGTAGIGAFARDNDKSSEQVGAGNTGAK